MTRQRWPGALRGMAGTQCRPALPRFNSGGRRWRTLFASCLAFVVSGAGFAAAAPVCPIDQGFQYLGQTVLQHDLGEPWVFATDERVVDADGAPNAYHPADVGADCGHEGVGLDCPASAGYPDESWWRSVLAIDPAAPNLPYVQQTGPYSGFFVSMTSLRDETDASAVDPVSYVDASRVPYLVAPAPILAAKGMGSLGDLGYALDLVTGRATPFVVADEGPLEPLGEASIAFWRALGGRAPSARDGAGLTTGSFVAVVFPGSAAAADLGWPIDTGRLRTAADERLARFGGLDALRDCALAQLADDEPRSSAPSFAP